MIVFIEIIALCILFTIMVNIIAKDPIKTLYNYPIKVQEKVRTMKEYQDKIPTNKNKITAKLFVSVIIIILVSLILKYINGYNTFEEGFIYSLLIWTTINLYDVLIIDICWFCQSKRFIFPRTEDIIHEYKNYLYHIKEGIVGQILGTIICLIIGLVISFI